MAAHVLLISNQPQSRWSQAVNVALQSLGTVQCVSEQEALAGWLNQQTCLAIIDATAIAGDVVDLVADLHRKQSQLPIVVATNSPTWQRARQVFLAGATDYIRSSLDTAKILAVCRDAIERAPCSRCPLSDSA